MRHINTRLEAEAYFWFKQTHLFGFKGKQQPLWLGTIIWYLAGVASRTLFIIFPILSLLSLLKQLSSSSDYYLLFVSIIIRIIQISLGSWIVFTFFIRPNAPFKLVPAETIRQSQSATTKLMINYLFMITCIGFLYRLENWLISGEFIPYTNFILITDIVIITVWIAIVISDWIAFSKFEKAALNKESEIILAGKALEKIEKYLSEKEQLELSTLLFRENALQLVNVKTFTSIVILSIMLELLWEVSTGLGSKLMTAFLGFGE